MGLAADVAGPVGFIGLGVMGSALSSHLLEAGYQVVGYDPAPARSARMPPGAAAVAGGPADVAAEAGLVVTSLPSPAALAEVAGGRDGLAAGHPAGRIVIETSTLAPADKEAARQVLAGAPGVAARLPAERHRRPRPAARTWSPT